MKKLQLTLIFLVMIETISLCQLKSKKTDIIWGNEVKESKKITLSDIVGYDKSGIYIQKQKFRGLNVKNDIWLEHYNNDMNLTKSVELKLDYSGKKMIFNSIIQFKDKLYVLSSFKNQKLKKEFLFAQTINKTTLQPENDLKKIAEISYSGIERYNYYTFDYKISKDSTKILIYGNISIDNDKKEEYCINVLDNNLNLIWEKNVTLPYENNLFELEDFDIDNSGNVHILGVLYKDIRKSKRNGKPNYTYQIISYFENGNKFINYPIIIEDKFLTDMKLAINNEQNLICAGFYSAENTFNIKGSFFLKIDSQTKQIITRNFHEFDIDFITQNMSEFEENKARRKDKKGKNVELTEYELDDIIIKKDGGAVLLGEQYYVNVRTSSSTNGTTTTYQFNYNDIIAINVSPEGKILWSEKIAKKQKTVNDFGFYSSYALFVAKDKLYFIFNDNPKNLFYKGEGEIYPFTRNNHTLVALVSLDSEGKQTREALFSAKDTDILIRPMVCEQISSKDLVLYGQKSKKKKFAKITFKE